MKKISQAAYNKAKKNTEDNAAKFSKDRDYPCFDQKGALITKDEEGRIVVHSEYDIAPPKKRKVSGNN